MSDAPPTKPRIHPWTIWIPIIIMALGTVILFNYADMLERQKKENRPRILARLETDLTDLTERSGKKVSIGELRGKVMVFSHVYTSCPVGCSQIVSELKDIYDEFAPKHPGLQFVSFAIDPDDGPDRLLKYAQANDITGDNWWFVNGDQPKIRTYLTHVVKFYPVIEKPKEKQTSTVDKFEHDMRVALIDHEGHLRGSPAGAGIDMYDIFNPDPELRAFARKRLRKDLEFLLIEQEKAAAKK